MIVSTLIPAESHIACQRQDIVIIDSRGVVCLVNKISTRTIDRILDRLVEKGIITKLTHGTYEKFTE